MKTSKHIVIIGAGTGGIAVAARLSKSGHRVTIIDPSDKHYYQPIFTLIGGGDASMSNAVRDMKSLIPQGVNHLRKLVTKINPDKCELILNDKEVVAYDYLVASPGIQIDWDKVENLQSYLDCKKAHTNYSEEYVQNTFEAFKEFKGGNALFTFPNSAVKCGGAPQKIMWLFQHYIEKQGLASKTKIYFTSAADNLFGVEKYRNTLQKLAKERSIIELYEHNLIALNENTATYEILGKSEKKTLQYNFIHVTPPMSSPDFLISSGLCDDGGWIDVNPYTLQSKKYKNVFALGDASNLPTAKTGAGIRKQAPVVCKNLLSEISGKKLMAKYNGYTSCPLVTGYGRLVLAEFGYNGKILETFPFNQAKERFSMYLLKKFFLPKMYWKAMMKGIM